MSKNDDKNFQEFLNEIFDPYILSGDVPINETVFQPSLEQIKKYAELVLKNENEEQFQVFLAQNDNLLIRAALRSEESILGIISKPPIGNNKIADFAIVSVNQGSSRILLVEIENPNDRLFTKKNTPALKLQNALGQVNDWEDYITKHKESFIKSIFEIFKNTPQHPQKSHNGSFIMGNMKQLMKIWNAFGGNDYCQISYLIVIGRFSKLNDKEKETLFLSNRTYNNITIRTFDNFIRKAIDGPKYFW